MKSDVTSSDSSKEQPPVCAAVEIAVPSLSEITDTLFDSAYDSLFHNLIGITEALLGADSVRISFVAGELLKGRAVNKGELCDTPLDATLCGIAVKRESSMEISHAQTDEISCDCPQVKDAGVNFYANRLIRLQGGAIVGTLCLCDVEPRILNRKERELLDGLGRVAGLLIQSIFDRVQCESEETGSEKPMISRVDFTSLVEVSPLPTALLSYPDFLFVAANDPMASINGLPLVRIPGECPDESEWFPDFRERLDSEGCVADLEIQFQDEEGWHRYFLVDGRIIEFDGDSHVLITGRDVTAERERDRSLRLLLEGTNVRLGDDWFRGAAEAFSELLDAELVVIAEMHETESRQKLLQTYAVFEEGENRENYDLVLEEESVLPILEGEPIHFEEDESDSELAENCPFWKPGIRFIQGVPIESADGTAIGAIVIASSRAMKALHRDHEAVFTIFASRAAAEIERLRADRARDAELRRTSLLLEMSRAISRGAEPDTMLQIAVDQIGNALEVSRCHVLRLEEDCFEVIAEYVCEPHQSMLDVTIPRGEGCPVDEVLDSPSSVAISDPENDAADQGWCCILDEYDVASLLAVRTSFEGEAKGVLVLHQCSAMRIWTSGEKSLLEGIAAQIGVGIARAELAERERSQRLAADDARRRAEAASRSKSEFLARMSHELRTPMNAILGFSQLLGNDENLDENQQETLAIINRSGEHLMALINDVLEMSKIEAGKLEMNRSTFNPGELVKSVGEMFQARAESRGLELIVDLPEDFPASIESDENKLRQIFTNLLGNAIKFTNEGRIELKGWYFSKQDSGKGEAIVAFRVKDTGIGISREDQKLLFAPFVQTDEGSSLHEGTGLGLTITKAFVELFGGEIELESEPGEGSAFVFWIPAKESETTDDTKNITTADCADNSERTQWKDGRPTVLIADDQPENRLLVVRYLKSLGYIVREAVDGQDAIDAVREYHPDAIIMDIRMPGTDGLAATRTIRVMEDIPFQPYIVALTGNAFEEDRQKAIDAGCDEFLAKPFKLEVLREKLSILGDCDSVPNTE
ncbi:MAG: ATP-binding protein [Verrucomicrobiales bacterium]|nr:ATP-binding protein [Verrucomicrobiales bacterium]